MISWGPAEIWCRPATVVTPRQAPCSDRIPLEWSALGRAPPTLRRTAWAAGAGFREHHGGPAWASPLSSALGVPVGWSGSTSQEDSGLAVPCQQGVLPTARCPSPMVLLKLQGGCSERGPEAGVRGTHRLAFGSTGPRPTLGSFHTRTSWGSIVALIPLGKEGTAQSPKGGGPQQGLTLGPQALSRLSVCGVEPLLSSSGIHLPGTWGPAGYPGACPAS